MFTFAGVLFLLIGLTALFHAIRALAAGRIWQDPSRAKFDPRWRPGRWVRRGARCAEFRLGVGYYLAVGATAAYFGLRWLLLQRL